MTMFLASASLGVWLDQTFAGFDMAVFNFFGSLHSGIMNIISMIFTAMGATTYVALFALFGLVLIFFRRTRKYGFALVAAIIIGTLLTNVLFKPLFLRVRPYNSLQDVASYFGWYQHAGMLAESDYSFPSGHTTGATEIGLVLCLCFASDRKWKFAWIGPVVAVLVGCSRIYLMVHYATDVLAGFIIGIIAAVAAFYISKALTGLINNAIDSRRNFKKKKHPAISGTQLAVTCLIAWLVIFCAGFIPVITAANSDPLRCAYDGDYKCYNEARTDDKYPAIDGNYYCKIHWKEITEGLEAAQRAVQN